jgi:hypothetical protein
MKVRVESAQPEGEHRPRERASIGPARGRAQGIAPTMDGSARPYVPGGKGPPRHASPLSPLRLGEFPRKDGDTDRSDSGIIQSSNHPVFRGPGIRENLPRRPLCYRSIDDFWAEVGEK